MVEGNEIARDLAKQAELLIGCGKLDERQEGRGAGLCR